MAGSREPLPGLLGEEASVDGQRDAGHEAGVVRCEEGGAGRDLLRLGETAHGDRRGQLGLLGLGVGRVADQRVEAGSRPLRPKAGMRATSSSQCAQRSGNGSATRAGGCSRRSAAIRTGSTRCPTARSTLASTPGCSASDSSTPTATQRPSTGISSGTRWAHAWRTRAYTLARGERTASQRTAVALGRLRDLRRGIGASVD